MSEIWILSAHCWICTKAKQYDDTMHECIRVAHRPTSKSSVSSTVHQDFFFGRNARNRMFVWEPSCVLEIEPLWSWRKHRCRKNQAYRSNTPTASKFRCTTHNPHFRHFHAIRISFVKIYEYSRVGKIHSTFLFEDKFGINTNIYNLHVSPPQNVFAISLLRQHNFFIL